MGDAKAGVPDLVQLQQRVGNQAVGRLLLAPQPTKPTRWPCVSGDQPAVLLSPDAGETAKREAMGYAHVGWEHLQDDLGREHRLDLYQNTSGGAVSTQALVQQLNKGAGKALVKTKGPPYHVLSEEAGGVLERYYPALKKESYAPVYQVGRFYTLWHPNQHYYKLETFIRNIPKMHKEAKRRKHAKEQVASYESQLRDVFGRSLWPKVRRVLLSRLPIDRGLAKCNFHLIVAQPTATVSSRVTGTLKAFRIGKVPVALEVSAVQVEQGFIFQRDKSFPTIIIDLAHGTLPEVSVGNLQVKAKGEMDFTVDVGDNSVGVSWKILDPIGEATTWKWGHRKEGRSLGARGGFSRKPYLQFLVEGKLGTGGRAAMLFAYSLAAGAVAAKAAAATTAIHGIARALAQVAARQAPKVAGPMLGLAP